MICIYTCQLYVGDVRGSSWQGPEGRETQLPKVGASGSTSGSIRRSFSLQCPGQLPDADSAPHRRDPDIRSDTDVLCAITDTSNNTVRNMPGSECQDPVQNGVYQQFPGVALSQGEVAWFFFPVKATRAMTDETAFGVSTDLITNPQNALPDPLWSSMPISVTPAPVTPALGPGPVPAPVPHRLLVQVPHRVAARQVNPATHRRFPVRQPRPQVSKPQPRAGR